MTNKSQIIAYYLPQYHPFKENDEWWGKGFTEWTNVGKAEPLFKGHNQPRVPTELGYYDLRLPIVREQQAELAREAGVDGFCYWHYWFGGEGRQLMNSIIDEVAATGKPDFPFCLGWANESWKSKQWNKDGSGDVVLMEQRYDGESDYRLHYEYAKGLFLNKNYVRIEGNPFFLIYKPFDSPEIRRIIDLWNKWIKEDGLADRVYFVASVDKESQKEECIRMGFEAVVPAHRQRVQWSFERKSRWLRGITRLIHKIRVAPMRFNMQTVNQYIPREEFDSQEDTIAFLLPQWDHTPRSGAKGYLTTGSTPELFQEQAEAVLRMVQKKKNKLIILKSWNEWAEGNYMEPDILNGKGFIYALKKAIENVESR